MAMSDKPMSMQNAIDAGVARINNPAAKPGCA
jgi:hypothetical protein